MYIKEREIAGGKKPIHIIRWYHVRPALYECDEKHCLCMFAGLKNVNDTVESGTSMYIEH